MHQRKGRLGACSVSKLYEFHAIARNSLPSNNTFSGKTDAVVAVDKGLSSMKTLLLLILVRFCGVFFPPVVVLSPRIE